ncbi:hypothetical protein C8J57DRAFT_957434, partial [Mycena rebaudengoi]
DLPPKEGRILYMACVDPHLISGADVIIDVDDVALGDLENVQKAYVRRILGLGQYSMRAPLFTEMGLLPLRYRRLIIALRYVKYLVGRPVTHYARIALEDSYSMYLEGKQGYWMDLEYAMHALKFPVELPDLHTMTQEICEDLGKAVHIIILRHYLVLVVNPRHRKALTRMLTSQHPLAVERLRYPRRYHEEPVPREMRKCRFGCDEVETVEHALFFCEGTEEMMARRASFKSVMCAKHPAVRSITPWNATIVLKNMVCNRDTICQLAKYVHRVFSIFEGV